MLVWNWHRRLGMPSLEDRMDKASDDHYKFCEGYYEGLRRGREDAYWLYRGVHEGLPAPPHTDVKKISPYRRLLKHYEKLWKQGER